MFSETVRERMVSVPIPQSKSTVGYCLLLSIAGMDLEFTMF